MSGIAVIDPEELARMVRDEVRAALRDELSHVVRPDRLLNARDAAALAGMSVGALRTATSRGVIPCVRRGRSVRYRAADVLGAHHD